MLNANEMECIQVSHACAASCLECASGCLQEDDPKALAHCIAKDLECADLCQLTAAAVARGDALYGAICTLCAKACKDCAKECYKHNMYHCRQYAQACEKCAQACSAIAA